MDHSPVQIFVLWHPDYAHGAALARSIFDWFRTAEGYGIPVHYRCQPDPRRDDGFPAPLPFDSATLNLVVVLAEANLVRDRLWRRWLNQNFPEPGAMPGFFKRLFSPARMINIYPVALDATAYKLPGAMRQLNFISPLGERLAAGERVPDDPESIGRALRTQLTEAFARLLAQPRKDSLMERIFGALKDRAIEPPKVIVFISHAKRDGTRVARALHDYICRETQLQAFFDQNDIAHGFRFAEILDLSLKSKSAAMIVVNGDHYSSRPWCRREVEIFSRPRSSGGVWEKSPILVVQTMEGGRTANVVPEFGRAPMLRWRDGDEALCIDTLLRDSIFASYHAQVAESIQDRREPKDPAESHRIYINWPPDPLGLDTVIREWERAQREAAKTRQQDAAKAGRQPEHEPELRPLEIVYPGRGLTAIELEALLKRFDQVSLRTFAEVRARRQGEDPMELRRRWLDGYLIGISVSASEDLLARGFGHEHLREFLMRLSRWAVRGGADLAYGGHFGDGDLTQDLIELISDELGEGDQRSLYHHSPWPSYQKISVDDEANFVDICRFVRITQELAGIPAEFRLPEWSDPADSAVVRAAVLSGMRRLMATGMTIPRGPGSDEHSVPPPSCRVLLAGRCTGFRGILPGPYEELLYCLEHKVPVYLVGGFGGAAGRIAGYLAGEMDEKAALLDFDALVSANPSLAALEEQMSHHTAVLGARLPSVAIKTLRDRLRALRGDLGKKLRNGLDDDANRRLFATVDTTEAATLVLRGLRGVPACSTTKPAKSRAKSGGKGAPRPAKA